MAMTLPEQLTIRRDFWLRLLVIIVGAHGMYVLATTLLEQTQFHPGFHLSTFAVDVPLLLAMGLLYLSTLLRRRKRRAWMVAIGVYVFMFFFFLPRSLHEIAHHHWLQLIGTFLIPLVMLFLLYVHRQRFTVKSDTRSFAYSLRVMLLVFLVTLAYGTTGFLLLDRHDFHEEISPPEAVHRTIDQFGLTSDHNLTAHTRRARVFLDSLYAVSVASLVYAGISLFQPIRARYAAQHETRQQAEEILARSPGRSEDFFKLWPHDKLYYFGAGAQAGIAYKVKRGVALVVADPFGAPKAAKRVLAEFQDECFGNDWLPAYVHTEPDWTQAYKRLGYSVQKLGEEAILSLEHFSTAVRGTKYFRQIRNKFEREGYSWEALAPPHNKALVARLQAISDEWLQLPERTERGFMMGYFSEEYVQQGEVIVARDAAGTIQAFINRIPSYDPDEANFDMLRSSKGALGNVNDYLLMGFIEHLQAAGIARLNMGLCPLSGLDESDERSIINSTLRFVYANGDRFYSFSGLRKFKAKYEPDWSDRYVAFPGGARNFVRVMNALNLAMRVKLPKPPKQK